MLSSYIIMKKILLLLCSGLFLCWQPGTTALAQKPPFDKRDPNVATLSSTGLEIPRYTGFRKVIAAYDKFPGVSDAELAQLQANVPGLAAVKLLPHTRTMVAYCVGREVAIQKRASESTQNFLSSKFLSLPN